MGQMPFTFHVLRFMCARCIHGEDFHPLDGFYERFMEGLRFLRSGRDGR